MQRWKIYRFLLLIIILVLLKAFNSWVSLQKLASNLSENQFIYTKEYFSDSENQKTRPEERQCRLMKEKGVYPYDYMDSFSKFNEICLPRREDFYSLLTDEDISDDDYSHAQDVWNTFQIKNMGDYHKLL